MLTTLPLPIPDPDAIRAAITEADERAKLLRRLLRASVKLRLHLTTADHLPARTAAVSGPGPSPAKAVAARTAAD